ncbi:MAG TPA: LLM class flavin-dependent oxidoreductase [Alphaproteobacteria bacterium]
MKFAFFMMPIHHPSENPALAFQRDIGFIHLADELGFDEFCIGEHHSGGWETMPVPEMALAMAAAKAHRIRLGTSVVNLPFHHPFHVAERIAFLDHLTRGRAILGIGPSALPPDKQLFQVPQEKLYPMMAESLDIIVKLLESPEPFDYAGRFWSFKNMRLQLRSFQTPRLPIATPSATGNEATLEIAARHGLHLWMPAGKGRPTKHADDWAKYEKLCAKYGTVASREGWRIANYFYLAESREEALADVERGILREARYFSETGLKRAYENYPNQPFDEFTPLSCIDRRDWVVGTPDDAIAWIEAKRKELGHFGGIMITTHEWTETAKIRKSLELFARYVMPHFQGHTQDLHDQWKRVLDDNAKGWPGLAKGAAPYNLAAKT